MKLQTAVSSECNFGEVRRPFSHFQSPIYPALLRAYGQEPKWFYVSDEHGVILADWLFFETPANYLNPPKNPISRALDVHFQAIHGPTIQADLCPETLKQVLRELLFAVRAYVDKRKPLSTSITLDPVLDNQVLCLWKSVALDVGFQISSIYTYAAELGGDVDDLFKRIKSDRRTKIRKAERENVVFSDESSLEGLREYYNLRSETTARNNNASVPWSHFEETWRALEGTGLLKVFLARHDGRLAAGQLAYPFNEYVHLTGVSIADFTLGEKIPANDYLQWRVLKWALQEGYKFVDFVGAQPANDDPKIKAIDQFKSRWGTKIHESLRLDISGSSVKKILARVSCRLLG